MLGLLCQNVLKQKLGCDVSTWQIVFTSKCAYVELNSAGNRFPSNAEGLRLFVRRAARWTQKVTQTLQGAQLHLKCFQDWCEEKKEKSRITVLNISMAAGCQEGHESKDNLSLHLWELKAQIDDLCPQCGKGQESVRAHDTYLRRPCGWFFRLGDPRHELTLNTYSPFSVGVRVRSWMLWI